MSALTIIVVVLVYVGGGYLYSRRPHPRTHRTRAFARSATQLLCVVWAFHHHLHSHLAAAGGGDDTLQSVHPHRRVHSPQHLHFHRLPQF
jgi:hypothetical protein